MYDALNVSKYVIDYENSKHRSVSNLRLQKLLYFVQAQFLVSNKTSCFADDIEAWEFGPVVPNVYHHYKMFGSSCIPRSLEQGSYDIEESDKVLINKILDKCARYSTSRLVSITHNQKPWKDAYLRRFDNTIFPKEMRTFFGG